MRHADLHRCLTKARMTENWHATNEASMRASVEQMYELLTQVANVVVETEAWTGRDRHTSGCCRPTRAKDSPTTVL
jgi:hypothetical protein